MTDLELLLKFIDTSLVYVSPLLVRELEARGLLYLVNKLPDNKEAAKAVLFARLAEAGKFYNEPEIDKIAGEIQRLNFLRTELTRLNMADVHKVLPVLKEMTDRAEFVKNYYVNGLNQ